MNTTEYKISASLDVDREVIARIIADHISGGFDSALQDKYEWKERHGLGYDCEPLDVNGPFKEDYLIAAREAYEKHRGEHVDACALNAAETRARAALSNGE